MAGISIAGAALRLGIVVVAILMVLFMLTRRDLYPIWTVALIAGVGIVAIISLVNGFHRSGV